MKTKLIKGLKGSFSKTIEEVKNEEYGAATDCIIDINHRFGASKAIVLEEGCSFKKDDICDKFEVFIYHLSEERTMRKYENGYHFGYFIKNNISSDEAIQTTSTRGIIGDPNPPLGGGDSDPIEFKMPYIIIDRHQLTQEFWDLKKKVRNEILSSNITAVIEIYPHKKETNENPTIRRRPIKFEKGKTYEFDLIYNIKQGFFAAVNIASIAD